MGGRGGAPAADRPPGAVTQSVAKAMFSRARQANKVERLHAGGEGCRKGGTADGGEP